MIGRGTRLCKNLFGDGEDKTEFYIFDYMRNFQFFDEHPKGKEIGVALSPVSLRFNRMGTIIKLLQDSNYCDDEYQAVRNELIEKVFWDIENMNPERVEVKLELRYVEKYKNRKEFECLGDLNKDEIINHLSKLVISTEKDEAAINFDIVMYGLIISSIEGDNRFDKIKKLVVKNADSLLSKCATIPSVKLKIPELKELIIDNYWNEQSILKFEETRKSLRDIMKFIPQKEFKIHYTNFEDGVVFRQEGRKIDTASSDFEDYRAKVSEYIETNKNRPVIKKLLHNHPISSSDYQELERIFTQELGTLEEYKVNYQRIPFGILIRKIAKMDRDSAYRAFSKFIAEERPNAKQIHFIEQVVDYVVENGHIEVVDLLKAPFDRPYKFNSIFTSDEQSKFVQIIKDIKNNAIVA